MGNVDRERYNLPKLNDVRYWILNDVDNILDFIDHLDGSYAQINKLFRQRIEERKLDIIES